jgi:hypothetical protein
MVVMVGITSAIFALADPARGTFRQQPEVADMQQRGRVAAAVIGRDLLMAGAGPASTAMPGGLVGRFPPVAPYRRGQIDDARAGVFYRPDAISLVYVPDTRAEADVAHAVDLGRELLVDLAPNCGVVVHERVCGFTVGMRVVLFDARGVFDLGTVSDVAGVRVRVQHAGALASAYDGNAVMAEVVAPTYFVRADAATGALQLVRYDGFRTDRPVVDNVVDARFDYFIDPAAPLGAASLTDGPWLPDGARATRFDADLLRIRRVRLRLRVQVAVAAMRGPAGRLFATGGTSSSPELFAPDQQVVLDVTPRNLGAAP